MPPNATEGHGTPVIGLTGGIGAGKTTVSRRLAELGAHVIDADSVGHQVLAPDGEAYEDIVRRFGKEVLDGDGAIDRQSLGTLVFAEPRRLKALNRIMQPHMASRMAAEIAAVRARPDPPPAIVVDAAILFEAGWDQLCDRVWTVSASTHFAMSRLAARDGMSQDQARARIDAQWSNAAREGGADRVIRNDGTLEALLAEIDRMWGEEVGAPPAE